MVSAMKTASDDGKLLELNKLGLIPGPSEDLPNFLERAEQCRNLSDTLAADPECQQAFEDVQQRMARTVLEDGSSVTGPLYDIQPTWVPLFFSNDKLSFWTGACTWIFQINENSHPAVVIQLRRRLHDQQHLWRIYSRQELVAHELIHVGRMTFNEPQYEEHLAYHCSSSPLRRLLGPCIQSMWEAVAFFSAIVAVVFLDLISLLWPSVSLAGLLPLKLVPVGMALYGLWRSRRRQRRLIRCIDALSTTLGDREKAYAVAYRLRDDEITQFSEMDTQSILSYARESAKEELRWRVVYSAYFRKTNS